MFHFELPKNTWPILLKPRRVRLDSDTPYNLYEVLSLPYKLVLNSVHYDYYTAEKKGCRHRVPVGKELMFKVVSPYLHEPR